MCSTLEASPEVVTVASLSRRVQHAREAVRAVSAALAADPSLLAEVPDELLESFALQSASTLDAATAVATVVVGRVERRLGGVKGAFIAGRYPSTSRFLEREAGMSAAAARVMVARGKDLDSHSTAVADAWLAGEIPGGAVQGLTHGVTDVLRRSSRTDTRVARREVLDRLLPVARAGRIDRLHRELADMRILIDPDGADEKALAAYEHQTLSFVEVGSMVRVAGWLPPETGVAARTVLEHAAAQIAVEEIGEITHDPDCELQLIPAAGCSCGEVDRARRAAGLRHDQLLARAFGEVMTDLLGNGELGTHHRVAPHLTIVADITAATTPFLGRLAMPGSDDDIALPPGTMHRLLCDADVTRVLTTHSPESTDTTDEIDGAQTHHRDSNAWSSDYMRAVVTTLAAMATSVLYVGRTERTVSARLRRALEVRDGHCVFPACRARVARCHAHHVIPWEAGGPTELPNTALLCVAHHHAVHEGGWTMTLKTGFSGHELGCWYFTPPPLVRRRMRP